MTWKTRPLAAWQQADVPDVVSKSLIKPAIGDGMEALKIGIDVREALPAAASFPAWEAGAVAGSALLGGPESGNAGHLFLFSVFLNFSMVDMMLFTSYALDLWRVSLGVSLTTSLS
jgi:hypothetical protein